MAKGNEVTFRAAAGEDWDTFVAHSVEQNCAGVECLSGIPGTVGGTPVQNVGAYGQDVSERITAVEVLHIASLERQTFSNRDCGFGYRSSIFNTAERDRYIILHVSFVLLHGGKPAVRYADLQKAFANAAESPHSRRFETQCAIFGAARRCSLFRATKMLAAWGRSSRILSLLTSSSTILRLAYDRGERPAQLSCGAGIAKDFCRVAGRARRVCERPYARCCRDFATPCSCHRESRRSYRRRHRAP